MVVLALSRILALQELLDPLPEAGRAPFQEAGQHSKTALTSRLSSKKIIANPMATSNDGELSIETPHGVKTDTPGNSDLCLGRAGPDSSKSQLQ